ncbi:MAG: DUF3467 domain-containing protein [Pseudolabrys sp.]
MNDTTKNQTQSAATTSEGGLKTTTVGRTRVHWEDSKMQSCYANIFNVATTREEVMLLFGTSRAWTQVTDELTVDLAERIILNPMAAKRLMLMLQRSIEEYERTYAPLG